VPPDEPETGGGEQPGITEEPPTTTGPGEGGEPRIKYVIADVPVYVVAERVQFYGADGKLITESLRDYTRACVHKQYTSMHDFLRRWSDAEQKKVIVEELAAQGVLWEPLAKEVENKLGKSFDAFDLICHVAFDQPPLSRRERAENVKKRNYFAKYGEQARQVLDALLEKYADTGIENIEDIKVLTIDPFSRLGTPPELVSAFGGKAQYLQALHELEQQLYQ
jgi:type I restriction enzyme R subunit